MEGGGGGVEKDETGVLWEGRGEEERARDTERASSTASASDWHIGSGVLKSRCPVARAAKCHSIKVKDFSISLSLRAVRRMSGCAA